MRPIVFLRSDIFDILKFGDKNKIRNANRVELMWNDDLNYNDASLKELMDWRIKESLGLDYEEGAWEEAFEDRLTRGTQHKFHHITFRTFLRPRDVIQFCNFALAEAKDRAEREGGEGELKITNDDIKAARGSYSEYFQLELDDELGEAEPKWEEGLEVLKAIGAASFTRKDFDAAYQRIASRTRLPWGGPEELLGFFYDFSVVGFEKTRSSGSGRSHHFRYQGESVKLVPDARSFLVHRGLKESLDISET